MMTTKKYSQDELNKVLWDSANSARSNVDGGIYKDYALTMLFLKYISDLNKKSYRQYKEKFGDNETKIQEKVKEDRFYLPQEANFDFIYKNCEKDNIGDIINTVLRQIEDHNEATLKGVFSVDFNSESILGKNQQRNKMLKNLIVDFSKIDFSEVEDDLIGNAYMYMIEKFGTDAGKKAGEFFTVRNVAKLLAKLVMPKIGDTICDPACGSGGLLLLAGEEVEKQGSNNYALYGQESTGSTFQLARMNMFLHNKDEVTLEWGDTLNNPLLLDKDILRQFDIVVSNPPFSLKKWGAENAASDTHNRFYRGVPPQDKGDFAFILHIVATLKLGKGRAGIIVPHGVLFRGGTEGKIREQLLKENIIDAVIGLPAGLFQTTGIPVAILIIDKSREENAVNSNKKDILFIEASKQFKAAKAQNELMEEHIDTIYNTYKNRTEIEKFSRNVPFAEIEENDFNLNITRYVDTFEEEEPIDIQANLKELAELEPQLTTLEHQMNDYLKQLGVK